MQYVIRYKCEGVIGTYYMSLIEERDLMVEDIIYSARMAVAKFLRTSQFEIISVHKCI